MAITDFDQQQADLRERRKRAREGQQFNAIPGQMVSGHYVAPHFTQVLAEGLRGYNAIQGEKQADQELKDLTGKRETAITDNRRAYIDALRGTDEKRDISFADPEMMGPQQTVTPAVAPDPMRAYEIAMESPDSAMRTAGTTQFLDYQKNQAAQAQQARQMQLLQSAQTPQAALQAGVPFEMVKNYYESPNLGREKVEFKDVGGQLVPVTQYGDTPTGVQPLTKTGNPFSDLVVRDAAGNIVPNAPLASVKGTIAEKSAPKVDARTYNTQETEQSKTYGKTLGEIRGKITQAGFDAPKQIAKLDRMEALLSGIDGGAAAPTLAQIASTANSFGIKLDKNLGPKEAAIALAINMASGLREPGTGPMTDKDFDNFLLQVPDLSKSAAGRQEIMTTLRAAIKRDQEAAQFARDYAKQNNGVIDDNFFDAMAGFYAERPVVNIPMPETNARGNQFRVVR
jgi:hypothetical protein